MFYSLLRIKTSYGFRRLVTQHDLFVIFLYCLFMVSFCNKFLWLHLYLPVCVLYCSEVGRFWVGVELDAPMKVYNLFKFFTCMQTIKLRQTTENNGGPFTSKSDAKWVHWASKSDVKWSWPSFNMWWVGGENGLFVHIMAVVTKIVLFCVVLDLILLSIYWQSVVTKTVWLPTLFKIS